MWGCPAARDIWGESDRCFQKSTLQGLKFIQVAEGIFTNHGKEALTNFVATARQIWFQRNEVVHGGTFTHPNIVVRNTRVAVEEFQTINRLCAMVPPNELVETTPCWTTPQAGWIKANWDASLDVSKERMGIGIVVRYHLGNTLAARSLTRAGAPDSSSAEAMGAYFAACFCMDLGIQKIILEEMPK